MFLEFLYINRWTNFLCLIVHTAMVFVTLHFAYWRWDRNPMRDTEHVTVRIYRVTQVPTPYMIENNLTKWTSGWNFTNNEQENDGFFLRDNGYPVRRQNGFRCTRTFPFIRIILHVQPLKNCKVLNADQLCESNRRVVRDLGAVPPVGVHRRRIRALVSESRVRTHSPRSRPHRSRARFPSARSWFWYWRQMDDCFCPWRWLEVRHRTLQPSIESRTVAPVPRFPISIRSPPPSWPCRSPSPSASASRTRSRRSFCSTGVPWCARALDPLPST